MAKQVKPSEFEKTRKTIIGVLNTRTSCE